MVLFQTVYNMYYANNNFVLKKHRKCIHNNAEYSCDQYKYHVTNKINLKEHNHCNNNDLWYSCYQCDYHANKVALTNRKREKKDYDQKSAEMRELIEDLNKAREARKVKNTNQKNLNKEMLKLTFSNEKRLENESTIPISSSKVCKLPSFKQILNN